MSDVAIRADQKCCAQFLFHDPFTVAEEMQGSPVVNPSIVSELGLAVLGGWRAEMAQSLDCHTVVM